MPKLAAALITFGSICSLATGDVWFVDCDTSAVGNGQNGRSWATAFSAIQKGLDAAYNDSGGEVWVAEGVYTSSSVYVAAMRENVFAYGGFLGNAPGGYETARAQRDWRSRLTVIDAQGDRGCARGADNASLDGFTLKNGKGIAIPMTPLSRGGGLLNEGVSPTIANCLFVNNNARSGSAIANEDASPSITNCVFLANSGMSGGAAISNSGESYVNVSHCVFAQNVTDYQGNTIYNGSIGTLEFRGCVFVENRCRFGGGGTVENNYGSPIWANCLFVHNYGSNAGVMSNRASTPVIVNCTFDKNEAEANAGAIMSYDSATPTVTNCILWNSVPAEIYDEAGSTTIVTYSDVQGGWAGEGNLAPARDPHFAGGPSGMSTALVYDSNTFKTTLTHAGAGFTPGAFARMILWTTVGSKDTAYVIADNSAESITVWGDVTEGGTVASPVGYAAFNYGLAADSPCIDAGRNTRVPEFASVTDDLAGKPRGQDGLGDGPTGPPLPGDGSDYDMGAYEAAGPFHFADLNRSGKVDAADVQLVINGALGLDTGYDCDANHDGFVNAADVQLVINAALGRL